LKIQIVAVGQKMPDWVKSGCDEYLKRLPREYDVKFVEIPVGNRSKNASITKAKQQEAEGILNAIGRDDWVVALDLKGKIWSTEQLASHVDSWRMDGHSVSILIGGPDGFDPRVFERVNQRWGLSHLTLPHPLVRILLVEQIYRAHSILSNHPYHK